jgi:hypothetical protein
MYETADCNNNRNNQSSDFPPLFAENRCEASPECEKDVNIYRIKLYTFKMNITFG